MSSDSTEHLLNNSPSKQRYSFGKATRNTARPTSTEFLYNLPSTLSHRGTTQGLGQRSDIVKTFSSYPPPTAYSLPSSFSIGTRLGFTFGRSRDQCKGMSIKELFTTDPRNPGPGTYKTTTANVLKAEPQWTIRGRLGSVVLREKE